MSGVSEEAVEALAKRNYEAEWGEPWATGWASVPKSIKAGWLNEAHAQCEAAAPFIAAKAWDEGAAAYKNRHVEGDKRNPYRSNP